MEHPAGAPPIAGAWQRLAAFIIDIVLLAIVGMLLGLVLYDVFAGLGVRGLLIGFVIAIAYFGALNSRLCDGQTFGKMIMKIRVVGRDGTPLGLPASLGRSTLVCIPWFLNGAPLDMELLTSWPGVVASFLTIGLGLAILYLFVFNRRTRQSVHDLAVGSCVVKSDTAAAPLSLPPIWRGHFAGLVLVGGLAAGLPVLTGQIAQSEMFGPLLELQQTMLKEPGVLNAGVHSGKSIHYADETSTTTTDLQLQVYLATNDIENETFANRIAQLALEGYPEADRTDVIMVSLAYGYDIGIASAWSSQSYTFPPEEWRQRLTATPGTRPLPGR